MWAVLEIFKYYRATDILLVSSEDTYLNNVSLTSILPDFSNVSNTSLYFFKILPVCSEEISVQSAWAVIGEKKTVREFSCLMVYRGV